jgi:PEP-CTERM motif
LNEEWSSTMKYHRSIWFTVVLGVVAMSAAAWADTIGYSVKSRFDDTLYRINLNTGAATAIGAGVGFDQVEGLSFHPTTNVLYGWDSATARLLTIDVNTGAGTAVGPGGVSGRVPRSVGLTFDAVGGLWLTDEGPIGQQGAGSIYSVNPTTGAATERAATGREIPALASRGLLIFGIDDRQQAGPTDPFIDALVVVDPLTGDSPRIGAGLFPGEFNPVDDPGIDFDRATGTLWGVERTGRLFTINALTGAGTFGARTDSGFESLAVSIPEPSILLLLGSGVVGWLGYDWRRRKSRQ